MTIPARPFLGTETLDVSVRALRRDYTRVYRDVYVRNGAEMTAADKAVAAWLWSGRESTMAGLSAAALHGSKWVDPAQPAEMFRRNGKPAEGIVIHRDELLDDERQRLGGIGVSTPARTAFDLGRRRGRTLAVVRVDALANATGLRPAAVEALIERHPGVRGLVQLRDVVALMDGGAESPQESRTRLMLIDAGLPRPQPRSWSTAGASTWATRISGSASNTTANSIGGILASTSETSIGWRSCWPEGGSSCG